MKNNPFSAIFSLSLSLLSIIFVEKTRKTIYEKHDNSRIFVAVDMGGFASASGVRSEMLAFAKPAGDLKFTLQVPLFVAEVFEDPKTLAAGGFDAVIVA